MKLERKVNAIFVLAGILMGVASKSFTNLYAVTIAIIVYLLFLLAIRKVLRIRKLEWYLSNSLVYFLVWLLVWILVFNQ